MWTWFTSSRNPRPAAAPSPLRERLEDRILFDGVPDAPVTPPDQPVDDPLAPAAEAVPSSESAVAAPVQPPQADSRTEVVFVDKRVGHYEELVADLLRDGATEVHFLDRNTNGLAQIERALAGRSDIDALHILSHGEQGQLRLGATLLTQESMQGAQAAQLRQIGAHLSANGDILIYGCNFAEGDSGAAAAETLAALTGADVAASINDTGHASRNADWSLELQTGLIETGVVIGLPAQQSWRGVLAADGDLQVELIAAPNFIVDSNKPESGPSAAYIGVKVTNTGADTLQNVFVFAGDFAGGNAGLYPVLTNPTFGSQTYSGDLALVHEGGAADATRYIGDLAAGETRVQYFLVSYPTTDANGVSLAGASSDPTDDVVLPYDIWVTADDPVDGGLEAVAAGQATLRSEISAMANKIWPNTDSKVPSEYLDAFQQQLGWRPDANAITPGAQVQLQGIWYDMGRVIGGYDGDGDLLPDYDVWMQPVGDASVFDAASFRLVKSYGVLIVKLNDGAEQVLAFEDELYHKDLPANNTGVVGLVFYEFIATGSQTQAVLSPYQEAASGSGNEKYNGDYGTSGGMLVSVAPEVTFNKDAVDAVTEAPLTSIAKSATLEYVLQATNTSATTALGLTTFGLPVVIADEVPDGTTYVLGSAAIDNSRSDLTILYSTDGGLTWLTDEPTLQPVTNIQWRLQSPLAAGETLEVTFQTTVSASFADAILANTGTVGLGSGAPLAQDTEYTLIQGTSSISGVVFADDGAGGATPSDGVRGGAEGVLDNIDVALYVDMDGDGAITAADILWGSVSTVGGAFVFNSLPDGDYLLQVAALDPDRPSGWTLTTDGLAALTIAGASQSAPDFGFGPVLDVDKELVGAGPIYEGDLVSYTIDVRNLLGAPWDESTGGFISYTAWAGGQHATLTTTTGSVANSTNAFGAGPDGAYAEIEFSNNPRDTLGAGTFVVDSPVGNITSVQLLLWGYGEAAHNNDELVLSAQTNDGVLHQFGTLTGAQIQSSTTPTLFTFDVTDADPLTPGLQSWQWSDFTALAAATGIQIETLKNTGPDRTTFFVDAIGFRIITDQSVAGAGTPGNTLVQVPLIDDYDPSALRFVSASIAPTSVDTINGVLTWTNLGTLLPGQSETITVTFEALEPAGNLPLSNVANTATSTGALLGDGSPANSDTDTVLVNLQPTAIIGDRVWLDHNNNQAQNGTEPGLSGVTVILRNSSGTEIARTTTDADGFYKFHVAANGAYTVAIDTATLPGTMSSTTGGNSRAVTIAALTDNLTTDFGYRFTQPVVYGNIWHDVDGDGLTGNTSPEAGEGGISGVTVVLYDVGRNRVNATVTTDAYGNYFIPVAQSGNGAGATYVGNYEVRVTTAGMFATGAALQTVDPDATRDNKHAVAITAADITGGNTLRGGFDFAYAHTGALTLGDQVFIDWNGDGLFDAGQDEGIPNLTVELYEDEDGDGVIDAGVDARIAVAVTDANGNYQFASLPAGDYIVRVDTADADYPAGSMALNGDSRAVSLIASTTAVDFAYIPVGSASITGVVWDDRNGDQTQAGSLETGLPNVTVRLYADLNGDGVYTLVRSTTTNASGRYAFADLPAGDFRVVVDESDPDLQTVSGAPRVLTTASGTLDVSLAAGAGSTGHNFGFTQLGSIGDTVFFDANRNGAFDDFESGIANVTVRLLDEHGALITTTVTSDGGDGNPVGYYRFANLAPGEYQVEVDVSTLPANAGANTADPDRDGVPSWDHTYPAIDALYPADNRDEGILIDYGVNYQGGDLGYEQTGIVGDRVWLDQNGDGLQQAGEVGLANVRVTASNGATTLQTFTNSDGAYVLTGLSAGVWTIAVDTATLPYSPTVATTSGADNSFTMTVNAAGAVTHIDGVDVTGQTDPQLAVDFGYRLDGPYAISGAVVLEATGSANGLSGDATDVPVGGLTVFLFRSTGELLATTTTAADGSYTFQNLPADGGAYDYVVALARNLPILDNTQLTTTAALTPADTITVVGATVRQQLSLSGDVTGLDFAFESTVSYDYGDLPAFYANTITDSPAGPRHILTGGGPYLGALAPDAEPDAVESPNADSDLEDDGVSFVDVAQWADGANGGSLQVQVTGSGWLIGWIDFDGDGSFSDANELIVNQAVSTGVYDVDFEIPAGTIDGNARDLFARFRLFAEKPLVPQLAFTGTAVGGEVEDYRIAVPQQTVTIGDAQAAEGGDLVFDITLASASRAAITLDLAATGVTAMGGTDYELGGFEYSTDGTTWLPAAGPNGTIVSFAPGVTAIQVRIDTSDDATREPTETLTLSVAALTGPAGDTSDTGTGSILDDDNTPPTTSNAAVTAVEDGSYTFQVSDFAYSDADSDPCVSIRITSLPADGSLVYDGTTIAQTQVDSGFDIAVADIGKLKFVPDADENGVNYAAFGFVVSDGIAESAAATMTVHVTPVNDAPTLSLPGDKTAAAGVPLVLSGLSIGDIDAGGGDVTVTLTIAAGTLSLSTSVASGLTAADVTGNGSGSVTLTGTLTEINSTLADANGLIYTGNVSGVWTLSVLVNDGGNSGVDPSTVGQPATGDADDERASGSFDITIPAPTLSVNDVTVTEGTDAYAVFTVSLSNPTTVDVSVSLSLADGAATGGGVDFGAAGAGNLQVYNGSAWIDAASATIAAGSTSVLVRTPISDDILSDDGETFTLSATVTAGTTANPSASGDGTIHDETPADVVYVSLAGPASVNEGAATTNYTVSLTAAAASAVTVTLSYSAGTAVAGTDYTAQTIVTIAAGSSAATFSLPTIQDAISEGPEPFTVTITGVSGGGFEAIAIDTAQDAVTTTIQDDDVATLSIADVTVTEGTDPYAVFTLSLSSASSGPLTVALSLADGSATIGDDTGTSAQLEYFDGADWVTVPAGGQVTIPAGETSLQVRTTIVDDALDEAAEQFTLTAAYVSGTLGSTADVVATGTILDDDPLPALSINDVTRNESDGTITFTVSLSAASGRTVTVNYAAADGTATAPGDFTDASGTLTFNPGETAKSITITLQNDSVAEATETFTVGLSGETNATVSDASGLGTILDNDAAHVSIDDVSHSEGNSGTTTYTFTVSLDRAVDTAVSVDWATAPGTTDAADLSAQSGSLTFAAGETSQTFSVTVNRDRLVEPDETFLVNLSGLSAAGRDVTIGDSQGVGTILNDDHAPTTANQSVSTGEDTDYTFQAADFPYGDADGDPLVSIQITSLPTDGTLLYGGAAVTQLMIDGGLTIAAANIGQLVFRPDANEFGGPYATFNFLVSDGVNSSTPAAMIVNVTSANDPPTARDNEYTTDEDVSVGGNLLTDDTGAGVDSDPDGGVLSVVDGDADGTNGLSPVSGPAHGAVVLNGNGTFTYTPDGDFFGDDSFTYRISDGQGGFDVATVTIHITPVNDDPSATDNAAEVSEDGPLTDVGNTLTDDDGDGLDSDPDGDPLHIAAVSFGASTVPLPGDGSSTTINGQYGTLTIARDGGYSYTLNNTLAAVQGLDSGESLTDTFTYELSDGLGGKDAADLVVTIHGVNDPPAADSNAITVQEGSADNPLGLAAPTDVDGETLTITVTGLPNLGTVTLANGAAVTSGMTLTVGQLTGLLYDAPAVYDGSPAGSFTYSVTDGDATVFGGTTITVTRPIANADGDSITAGDLLPASGNVLGNDTDPENDPLTVTQIAFGATSLAVPNDGSNVVINGTYGTLTIHSDGSYAYDLNTAHPDVVALAGAATLSETFTYDLADGHGGADSADLVITIHGQNDPPVATDNTAAVTEDGPTADSGNVLTDDDGGGQDSDPDSDPLAVSQVAFGSTTVAVPAVGSVSIDGAYGTLTISADGAYTYTLNNSLAAVQQLGDGEQLFDVFRYTASDGSAADAADLTVTINGANDDPTPVGTLPDRANVDGQLIAAVDVSGAFDDVDLNDSLTYDDGGTLPPGLSINTTTGLITGTLPADASQGGAGGVYSVVITVTDLLGRTASQTFQWTVANPAPTATDNTGSVREDGPLTDAGNLLADDDGSGIDGDPDGDSLTVAAVDGAIVPAVGTIVVSGAYGTLTIDASGAYTYTLNNTLPAVQSLGRGESLADSFTYTLSDGEGGADTATLVITIHGENDAPTAGSALPARANLDGQTIAPVDVSAAFSDPDSTAVLTFTAGGTLPPGLTLDPATGRITGTLTASASQGGVAGVYTVVITATDEHGAGVTQSFFWTVTNPAPTARDNFAFVGEAGPAADSGNLIADNDGAGVDSDPDGDALQVTAVNGINLAGAAPITIVGQYGSLQVSRNGAYTYVLNGSLAAVQQLAEGETLTESFDYLLSDGQGGTDAARLIVTIQGANDPPQAVDDANSTDSDTPITGRVLPNDADPDPGDALTVVAVNGSASDVGRTIALPSGALLRLNADGTYAYDPHGAFDHLGPTESAVDTFTYTITDPHGGTDTATVVITIAGLNDPPIAWGELMHTPMDQPITVRVLDNDTDPNGEPLSVIMIAGPDEGTAVVGPDGAVTFTPAPGFTGTVAIRYLAEDPHGASCPATLLIVVDPPNPVDPAGPIPAFGFDAFNNFSRPRQVLAGQGGVYRQPLLSREIFTLAPEPTFSGYARPGTMVVGRIYDERGVLIGEGFAHSDPGGNWMMQFQGIAKFEHYRIEFDYVVESQDIYGYLGLDPSDNSYQAMQPRTDWVQPLSVANALRQSPWHSLNSLHHSLQRPLGFGRE